MESWVLEGDSYSFHRSAPHSFNLRNRDGPNRVEIFDITSIPSPRSAISETTCLCDIFGDDCESPTLSSSPASTSFLKRDVDEHLPPEDVNDSSGSYHTAPDLEYLSDTSDASGDPSSPQTDLTLSNDKSAVPSPKPTHADTSDPSQTENQQESAEHEVENTYTSAQQQILSMSEYRDTNIRVTDSSQESMNPDLLSENRSIIEETDSMTLQLKEISTQSKEQEITFSENPDHKVTSESVDKSSEDFLKHEDTEVATYEASCENSNVVASPVKNDEKVLPEVGNICCSPTENLSLIQETAQRDCSVNLNNFCPEDSDFTSIQSCLSTSNSSITTVSPDFRGLSSSPVHRDIPFETGVTMEPKDTLEGSSSELMRVQSPTQTEDKTELPASEDSYIVPSPTLTTEENTEINLLFVPQTLTDSPESKEVEPTLDHRRLSLLSDKTERTEESHKVSEFSSFSDSSVAVHSEPSIIIHSPVGYMISPSPESERKCPSPESILSNPDNTDDYKLILTNFRGSDSLSDSKVCLSPESSSITSTPESRQHLLTPESMPTAASPELRSATGSPEITTRSSSSLSQNPKSPQIEGITYRVVSPHQECLEQSPDAEGKRYAENSTPTLTNLPTNEIISLSISPTSNISSTLGSISRPSSATLSIPRDSVSSPEIRDQRSPDTFSDHIPVLEPCILLGKASSTLSTVLNDNVKFSLCSPIDGDQFRHIEYNESSKSCSSSVDKSKDSTPTDFVQTQAKDSESEPPDKKLSKLQMKETRERINDSRSDLIIQDAPNSLNSQHTMTGREMDSLEENDNYSAPEILERESVDNEDRLDHLAVKCRKSPNVFPSDNNKECERQPWSKGWSKEKAAQKHTPVKGVENVAEGSYIGEQVELSLSARNRKGPASHSSASLSRDPKSRIPARCYFESSLTTRQQQSLLRAQSLQIKDKSGSRRVQTAFQSNHSSAGHLPSECTSETSSMGSELDEADNEVKWFTDLAFRSLSSPQGDYLDVYNSSHRSSTNVSQPSTVESPGAVTWMSYADLRGSALHENDVSCHASTFLPHGMLDAAKRFEMGSFECVDVAVESMEQSRRGRRTVPKRQIQLKRRNTDESKSVEKADDVINSSSLQRYPRFSLVRQHSTPPGVSEDLQEGETLADRNRLQKSASLDETSTKTKMASTIIKSVLSKKMETPTKESSKSESPSEDKKKSSESLSAGVSTTTESPTLPSESSLFSEDSGGRDERSLHVQKKCCPPKVLPKPIFKANCIHTYSNTGEGPFQGKAPGTDQMADSFGNKIHKKRVLDKNEKVSKTSNVEERYSSDSANAAARNSDATQAGSAQSRMSRRGKGHPATTETPKHQDSRRTFLSKTNEITLKPSNIQDKKKFSPKVSLSPDLEMSRDPQRESQKEETLKEHIKLISDVENEDNNETNKPKAVMHKVRDVRKLVKNTYNLSFKAPNTTHVEDAVSEQQKETQPQNPHALHIEYKAISRKSKQESDSKPTSLQEETQSADKSELSQACTDTKSDFTGIRIETASPNTMLESPQKTTQLCDINTSTILDKCNSVSNISDNREHITNAEMPPRPASKETSTLVFLQDDTLKATQKPASPVLSDVKTSSHSVSMLRKEKGMQADIGICDVLNETTSAVPKHINKLEVPLQTCTSEGTSSESQKGKKEAAALPSEQKASVDSTLQASQDVLLSRSSPGPLQEQRWSPSASLLEHQNQEATLSMEEEKKLTSHATSVTKISALLATSSKAAVRSLSSNTKSHAIPVTTSKEIELPIQVRSISSDRQKPSVTPKLSYKQPIAEIRSISSEVPKTDTTPAASIFKQQPHLKCDDKKNEIPATPIPQEQSTETSLNNTKKLAVSAVSSYKPPPVPLMTTSIFVQKSTSSAAATDRQEDSITSVLNRSNRQQENLNVSERLATASSCVSIHPVTAVASQVHTFAKPETSKKQLHQDDFNFYASDDPPSYDERESFSPLLLSNLPPRKLNKYSPTTKHSPCCCTSSHPPLGHPYPGSQNRTPPTSQSPGHTLSYPGGPPQAQVRPHQCRPDGQALNYPSVSPKTNVPKAPAMVQPLHHSHAGPAPVAQSCGDEQQSHPQHLDKRSANLRSPQTASGAPYREHSRSPNIAALDPRSQFFNAEDMPTAFGHDYGGDGTGGGGVLYPENSSGLGYGQGPRRVLLDPETGKYFYIEVPVQPLRKMLFDPEIGQYVEVLIPQQTMSHSAMYPPTAAPYPSLHGPGLYAPQYLPYAVPPHPPSAPQPRHQEPSVPTSLHQTTMGFGSSASQTLKSEAKSLPALDQSYLESMYYIPTGMNASPNSPASDCYHKPSPHMPPAGGRRA